jgi:hypothetical protein
MACVSTVVQSEEERLRDQREREQLELNIRERDAAGTRKVHNYIKIINLICFF